MHWIDVLIIVAFIAYAITSGFRARKTASLGLEEYFLAGRSLPGWKAGISMAATQFAADTPLLVTGLIATAGVFYLWRLWIYALAFLLLGFVLAPCWRRANVITDAELTEQRYSNDPLTLELGSKKLSLYPAAMLRGVKAIYFGTIFNCTVLAMVLFATKEIAEPFLLWNEWLPAGLFDVLRRVVEAIGMPLARGDVAAADFWIRSTNNIVSISAIVAVTTLYSTTGGLRSVVNTDVMQFALMMLGTILYAAWVVDAGGGMRAIIDTIREQFAAGGPGGITPDEMLAFTPSRAKDVTFALLSVFALQWLVQMNADGTGYLAQRSMACRSDKDAKLAAVIFTVAQIFFRSIFWLPIGLGLLVIFPPDLSLPLDVLTGDREATYVLGIKELLPPGVLGLMLTGMLAALASTIDTHLNWGSSYWTNDIYKRFVCESWMKKEPSQRSLVWVARVANIGILIIALAVMTQLSSIQAAWQTSLLLGAGMGVMLVLRWIWWRINAWGEIATIVASTILAPILLFGVEDEALRLLLMALGATTAGVVTSLVVGPDPMEHLTSFFDKVRPPGFWRHVALASGVSETLGRKRLARDVAAMVLAALSIFALLTGFGSWLVDSPAPVWLPWRGVWIAFNLVVGAALVPVWWKLGFSDASAPAAEPAADRTP